MEDIKALDFSMIKLKLMDAEEGTGWTEAACEAAEEEYRRFLALKRQYPAQELVPRRDVDKFWHQHILDTAKYAEDCFAIFGAFLHHYPYFGMRDEADFASLCEAFAETNRLYELHFGESGPGDAATCRTKCKPVRCK